MGTTSGSQVVVFDLDGTLVDVSARDFAIYRDLLTGDGLVPLPFEEYWPLRRARTALPILLARSTPDPTAYLPGFVARRADRYEAPPYLALDTVLPDVLEVLATLRSTYDCILITSRSNPTATEEQLQTLGLHALLAAVHVADGDKAAPFRTLAGVAMVVGDTEHDIALARDHGYPSFAVSTGIRSRELLAACQPTYLADRLMSLLDVL